MSKVSVVETRNEVLNSILDFLAEHPRFSYIIPKTRYYKTFKRHYKSDAVNEITRWHTLNLDWKTPYTSVWDTVVKLSDNISREEHAELRQLTGSFDQEYLSEGKPLGNFNKGFL